MASIRALCGMAGELFLGEVESGINLILHSTSQYKDRKTQTDANPDMIEKRKRGRARQLGLSYNLAGREDNPDNYNSGVRSTFEIEKQKAKAKAKANPGKWSSTRMVKVEYLRSMKE